MQIVLLLSFAYLGQWNLFLTVLALLSISCTLYGTLCAHFIGQDEVWPILRFHLYWIIFCNLLWIFYLSVLEVFRLNLFDHLECGGCESRILKSTLFSVDTWSLYQHLYHEVELRGIPSYEKVRFKAHLHSSNWSVFSTSKSEIECHRRQYL